MAALLEKMREQIRHGKGFIAALDQSGGSTPQALSGYGIGEDDYSSQEEMFVLIHAMRCRIMRTACFDGSKILGAILFEKTMDGTIGDSGVNGEAKDIPAFLHERGIIPFLKVDQGLEPQSDGVQLMKPLTRLEALCRRATDKHIFGTKMRSVIHRADAAGIAAIVRQQFDAARRITDCGLVPILEPEVNIKSSQRAECDRILRGELLKSLDSLDSDQPIMLKLSIPVEDGLYAELTEHPKLLRIVALSGGFSRSEACAALAENRGMIASFGRALIENLQHQMSNEKFNAALGEAIDQIYAASIT